MKTACQQAAPFLKFHAYATAAKTTTKNDDNNNNNNDNNNNNNTIPCREPREPWAAMEVLVLSRLVMRRREEWCEDLSE